MDHNSRDEESRKAATQQPTTLLMTLRADLRDLETFVYRFCAGATAIGMFTLVLVTVVVVRG